VCAFLNGIVESILETLHEMLVSAIMSSFDSIFDSFNDRVDHAVDIAGMHPEDWVGGTPWQMVQTVAYSAGVGVMLIAGLILGFFLALDLIQALVEKNNFADIDVIGQLIKWIVKSFIAITILANVATIIGAIFAIGQGVIQDAGGAIMANAALEGDTIFAGLQPVLEDAEIYELVLFLLQIQILRLGAPILGIVIFVVTLGRMFEIMMYLLIAPIPLATMANQEYRTIGNNYLKGIFAVAFQGLLILAVIAILGSIFQDWAAGVSQATSLFAASHGIWSLGGYTIIAAVAIGKTSAISKSIFNAT